MLRFLLFFLLFAPQTWASESAQEELATKMEEVPARVANLITTQLRGELATPTPRP